MQRFEHLCLTFKHCIISGFISTILDHFIKLCHSGHFVFKLCHFDPFLQFDFIQIMHRILKSNKTEQIQHCIRMINPEQKETQAPTYKITATSFLQRQLIVPVFRDVQRDIYCRLTQTTCKFSRIAIHFVSLCYLVSSFSTLVLSQLQLCFYAIPCDLKLVFE